MTSEQRIRFNAFDKVFLGIGVVAFTGINVGLQFSDRSLLTSGISVLAGMGLGGLFGGLDWLLNVGEVRHRRQ